MEDLIYHIKIKKDYASELIKDLLKVDAIEVIQDSVPEWQKEETLRRIEFLKNNPESAISEKDFFELLANNE
ncbi:hypothetical protein I5M32_03260 [Pedobacter sp. SD-b]|uniref:Addiction module component n=1 Tax=Pedobacter segetis TaxID=2793069 RepID=A0ABS1BGH3_9SPHI|nr:hypothetical protein [Pedobacter segetis]MBK0381967.1 hypothetical protein [Pedobacter segetis]